MPGPRIIFRSPITCLLRTNSSVFPQRLYIALWFFLLSALAAIAAYYWMFTGFSVWDDEGTVLFTVRQFLGGMKLYDQISGYGPVYYFYNWILRTASGTPATHDTVRMSSLIPWLLTALVCAWIVLRLTRSLLLASFTHILTFLGLWFFRNEPGHPQELCILLMMALVASGITSALPRSRLPSMFCLGALPAALLLIKVNIGVFMILAVALAVLSHLHGTRLPTYLFGAVAGASVILPFAIMKAHLDERYAERYCLVVVGSTIAMLLALTHMPRIRFLSLRDFWIVLASFIGVVVAVLLVLIVGEHVSPYSILNSLVLVNLRVSINQGLWYVPLILRRRCIPWIFAGLGGAIFVSKAAQNDDIERSLFYLKLILGPLSAAGVVFFGQSLLAAVAPFSWLVLYAPTEEVQTSQSFARTLLCSVTVIQTLYAYPIAGSQSGFIQVPLIIVAIVCLGDFFVWYGSRRPAASSPILRVGLAMALLCVPALYLLIAGIHRKTYNSLMPLDLPGARRIHLGAAQARDYHWLVQNLKANCDIFFGMPELPSLHIWVDSPPPAGLAVDDWMLVLTDKEQAAISSELSMHPRPCVFYNPQLVAFWNRSNRDMDALPLAGYIHTNFKVVGSLDDFSFLVRNDRDIGPPSN
jgi:hypothetical protein